MSDIQEHNTFSMDTFEGDKTQLWDIVLQGNVIGTVEVPETHTEVEIKRKLLFLGYDQRVHIAHYSFEG